MQVKRGNCNMVSITNIVGIISILLFSIVIGIIFWYFDKKINERKEELEKQLKTDLEGMNKDVVD